MERCAFFDMDSTLISIDSDESWKKFLVDLHLAPPDACARAEYFYGLYRKGTLDPQEFHLFQLAEVKGMTEAEAAKLCRRHFEERIRPKVYAEAFAILKKLQSQRIPTVILTSTSRPLAAPTAEFFGVDELLCTEVELVNGRYTGRMQGVYAGGKGKVAKAEQYCAKHGLSFADLSYYGDGFSDRFILETVGFPHAVNPCPELKELAQRKNWPILDFHKVLENPDSARIVEKTQF